MMFTTKIMPKTGFTIRFSKEMYQLLKNLAKVMKISMSEVVRRAVNIEYKKNRNL